MSRQNKVNPDHYTRGGRLSPDDLARERRKQGGHHAHPAHMNRPPAPWMLGEHAEPKRSAAIDMDASRAALEHPTTPLVDDSAARRSDARASSPRPARKPARSTTKRAGAGTTRPPASHQPAKAARAKRRAEKTPAASTSRTSSTRASARTGRRATTTTSPIAPASRTVTARGREGHARMSKKSQR